MVNLASNLVDTANGHADRVAVRVNETAVTYEDLAQASSRVAGMLRERGVGPGDPVGIMLPNVAEFAVVYYGVLRAGAVVVPMNPLLKAREVSYYLGDSGPRQPPGQGRWLDRRRPPRRPPAARRPAPRRRTRAMRRSAAPRSRPGSS